MEAGTDRIRRHLKKYGCVFEEDATKLLNLVEELGRPRMRIFLSPHNDDEALFGSIIIQRMKPLLLVIVTDSFIQAERGDPITWQQRRHESALAAKIMGVPISFLGIPDRDLTHERLIEALRIFHPNDEVLAPALQGGNANHDVVAKAAGEYFNTVWWYATYAKGECFTPINATSVHPSPEEALLKEHVLACYTTQLALGSTRPHFEAVTGQPEYLSFHGWMGSK